MNLLTAELTMTKIELDMARDAILRTANHGVEDALSGKEMHSRIEQSHLEGIWAMAPNHPLGHLAHRAQLLVTAAQHHFEGSAFVLHPTDKKLAGFTEGETA